MRRYPRLFLRSFSPLAAVNADCRRQGGLQRRTNPYDYATVVFPFRVKHLLLRSATVLSKILCPPRVTIPFRVKHLLLQNGTWNDGNWKNGVTIPFRVKHLLLHCYCYSSDYLSDKEKSQSPFGVKHLLLLQTLFTATPALASQKVTIPFRVKHLLLPYLSAHRHKDSLRKSQSPFG